MKKLLFYISTLDGGGAEKVLINLLHQLDEKEYDITVHTLFDGGVHEAALPKRVKRKASIKAKSPLLRKLLATLYHRVLPRNLYHRLFIKGDYDIEIGYLTGVPSAVIQASKNKKSKKICFVHGNVAGGVAISGAYGSPKKANRQYRKCDKVCFVSRAALDSFVNVCGDTGNLCVLHNVIDVDDIVNKAAHDCETGYDETQINIITVGRYSEEKGCMRLLKAVNNLKNLSDRFTVTLLGAGPMENELRDFISQNNITNVRLEPFKENPFPFVAKAHLFFCPSYTEGYSTAVTEAVLIGTPVITTDCDGMNEIFADSQGGRIIENSDSAIRDALEKYITGAALRETLKKETEQKKTSFRKLCKENVDKYISLFEEVLKK